MIHYIRDSIEVFRSGDGRDYSAGQNCTRDSRQQSLLRILSVAHDQRLDASVLISNLADEYWGSHRYKLKNLASRIAGGASMAAAIEQSPGLLSESQVLAIQFGVQTGTLSDSLASMVDAPHERSHRKKNFVDAVIYPCVVAIFACGILAFVMVFIVPMMHKIANEFNMTLPPAMALLIGVSNWIVNYWYVPAGALLIAVLFSSTALGRRILRPIGAGLPWSRNPRSPEFLQMLAIATEAGRPLPAALSTLGRYHYDPSTRQRLLMARNEVEQGEDVWKSLAVTGLLTKNEASGLASLQDPRSRAWAMRQLSLKKRVTADHRGKVFQSFLQPILVLILAAAVALIAISFMEYLAGLTLNLTAAIG